jgi:carbamoyl-phosphate synthase large subunit
VIKTQSIFLSLPNGQKAKYLDVVRKLAKTWTIYATKGTHEYFKDQGIKTTFLYKLHEKKNPSVTSIIAKNQLGLMICVPAVEDEHDAYTIRRLAIDNHIPLITNAEIGRVLASCLAGESLDAPIASEAYVAKQ